MFWIIKQLYYNFKNLIKNKYIRLIIIFIIAILFILIKQNKVFASFDFTYNGNNYSLPDLPYYNTNNYSNYVIFYDTYYSVYKLVLQPRNGHTYYRTNDNNLVFSLNNSSVYVVGYEYYPSNNFSWSQFNITQDSSGGSFSRFTINNQGSRYIVYSSEDILINSDGSGGIYFNKSITSITPTITTSSADIINFSFNNLTINAYTLPYNDYYEIKYTYPDNNTLYTADINNYKTIENDNLIFNIPKSFFTNDIVIRSGSCISFDLVQYHRESNAVTSNTYSLGSYTLDLTEQEQQEINEDSNKQLLNDISSNQQQTTNAVNNLNNSITDSSIDDNSIYLPTDNTNDITQEGLNGIFTSIYNAFCTGEAQDIVFPIPFTNKNITLPANYLRDMLSSNGASWIITIIEAFWWYLISRFIIKDIANKITKIKSGNIEDIENSNIKGDML